MPASRVQRAPATILTLSGKLDIDLSRLSRLGEGMNIPTDEERRALIQRFAQNLATTVEQQREAFAAPLPKERRQLMALFDELAKYAEATSQLARFCEKLVSELIAE